MSALITRNDETPYKVWVVVDSQFGERLATLPAHEPIWIIDSPSNASVVRRLWKERPNTGHLTGITAFRSYEGFSDEVTLLDQLDSIDLHHGQYSTKTPYSVLEAIGCLPSGPIHEVLAGLGFHVESSTPEGFIALRNIV